MPDRPLRRGALALGLSLALAGAAVIVPAANALPPAQARKVEKLARHANELRQQKRYDEAVARLKEALAIYPAPWLVYNLGRTYEDAGKTDLARASYERCLRLRPSPKVRQRASQGLKRIAHQQGRGELALVVRPAGAEVTVDGQPWTGGVVKLTPGPHRVEVSHPGHVDEVRDVQIRSEARLELVIELDPEVRGSHPASRSRRALPAIVHRPDRPAGPSYNTWALVTLSAGVAVFAAGVVTFALGEGDWKEVRDADGYGGGGLVRMTEVRADSLIESGRTKRIAGAVVMAIGGASVLSSLVLFGLDARARSQSRPSLPRASLQVVPSGALFQLQTRFD